MNSLRKGAVKSSVVECSGPGCKKKISKLTATPIRNVVFDRNTNKQKELSPRQWLCDDCLKSQSQESLKKDENSKKRLNPDTTPTGPRPMAGSLKDVAAELSRFAGPKVKVKPEKLTELERLAIQETKKHFGKEDLSDHPDHIKNIMARHKAVIPANHQDRTTMAGYINQLHFSKNPSQRAEAKRLYDVHISGGGAYVKEPDLTKSNANIDAQLYSDGSIDVIFGEDVSDILEKTVVAYLQSQGYDEVLEKGLKAKHKSKKGGMTAAGVKAYRRKNPGSKLQTAVTEDKPTGKRAKRRRSFCARMSGVKGPMKDKNGKPTRKALALRRWKC